MKLIQANPIQEAKQSIYQALNQKERELRASGYATSFYKEGRNKWKHVKHKGWVVVSTAEENILFAKVKSQVGQEEKIFEAFIGYLTRHCGHLIDSLTIYYR